MGTKPAGQSLSQPRKEEAEPTPPRVLPRRGSARTDFKEHIHTRTHADTGLRTSVAFDIWRRKRIRKIIYHDVSYR